MWVTRPEGWEGWSKEAWCHRLLVIQYEDSNMMKRRQCTIQTICVWENEPVCVWIGQWRCVTSLQWQSHSHNPFPHWLQCKTSTYSVQWKISDYILSHSHSQTHHNLFPHLCHSVNLRLLNCSVERFISSHILLHWDTTMGHFPSVTELPDKRVSNDLLDV